MKLLLVLTLFAGVTFADSDALDVLRQDQEYIKINQAHCQAGVEHACFARDCLTGKNQTACDKMKQKTAENLKAAKERMQNAVLNDPKLNAIRSECDKVKDTKCPAYYQQMGESAKQTSQQQVQIFDEQCKKADKAACYYRDVMSYGLKKYP